MPAIVPTGWAAILTAVETQLITVTGFPNERINNSTEDGESAHFQGDQDIVMRTGNLTPVGPDIDSKGRLAIRIVRQLQVIPRTSIAVDTHGLTDAWLTDPSFGHLQLEEAIFNALQGFEPSDANGNWLVTEPMRLVPSQPPIRPAPPDLKPAVWGSSTLTFEITYLMALNPQGEL